MSKDRKRDRKRRKKLEKDKRRPRPAESLAYHGSKYKKEKLVPTWMHAEIGIYQTYVVTDRKLLDQTVVSALEKVIGMVRAGTLPKLSETGRIDYEVGNEEDLVIANIRRSWADHFATEWKPSGDQLIGVLRTILASVENVKSPGPRSQSYMRHIAGFLTKKLGVSLEMVAEDGEPVPEPEEDDLVQLGRQWGEDGNLEARIEFLELATDLMKSGQANRVIDACDLMVGEISDPSSAVAAELTELNGTARRSLLAAMG